MNLIMSKMIPILLVACLGMNVFGSDQGAVTESQVLTLLRGFEWQLDAEALRALPADTYKILIEIARGNNYPAYIKSRALATLGHFRNDMVWTFLQSELAIADRIERRRILDTICATFSEARPRQVEAVIDEYLKQEDAHLRVAVARCLQAIGSVSSIEKIKQYQKDTAKTAEPWERNAVNR